MCTKEDFIDIKHRLQMVETQVRALVQDMQSYKGMVDEHLKKDKARTLEFRKREDFFIQSVMRMQEMTGRAETAFKEMTNIVVKLGAEHGFDGPQK